MIEARLAYLAAVLCLVACLAVVAALVGTRIVKDAADRRRARLRGPVWLQVLALTTGEDDEAAEAAEALSRLPRSARDAVAEDAFALVPKLRGASRERLRQVLRSWGLMEESRAMAQSRSLVRRCRGLHRIGALGDEGSSGLILAGLRDRQFAVRRTSMLAAASFPDPGVVAAALDSAVDTPRLRHDFLATMDRIGAAAVPVLRHQLGRALRAEEPDERRGFLAAEALGLVGAISAAPALEEALASGAEELRLACIEALGELGLPSSAPVLAAQLHDPSPELRRAAARALGRIGGDIMLTELAVALDDPNLEVARAAAQGLQRSGPAGMLTLRAHPAPVARETVALAALGSR